MQRNTVKKKRRGGILILLLFFSLLLILSVGKRGFIQQYRVRQERKRLEVELESLNKEKEKLEEEIEKLDDPEYIEKVAREEYGMAKENEKVYRVVPQEKE